MRDRDEERDAVSESERPSVRESEREAEGPPEETTDIYFCR